MLTSASQVRGKERQREGSDGHVDPADELPCCHGNKEEFNQHNCNPATVFDRPGGHRSWNL